MDLRGKKILITGGAGFLGSHVVEKLLAHGVVESDLTIPRAKDTDLREKKVCRDAVARKDIVIHLAAKAGGIGLNREKPGELFYDNLIMGAQLMEEARLAGVQKYVSIGTVCSYPKFTPVPFKEEDLWNGYPEETNAPYGLAKKMQLVQAQAYRQQYGFNAIHLLPVNLYGPRDNFDLAHSHVIPALIRKIDDAKKNNTPSIEVWGTGAASREFLYVGDAAEAIVLATEKYDEREPVNIGAGEEVTIRNLVELLAELMEFTGELVWNASQPDGQPRRKLNTTRAREYFGFTAQTPLRDGLAQTIAWFRTQHAT